MTKPLEITHVIVIPTFNELDALPQFLLELLPLTAESTALVIADDSVDEEFARLKIAVSKIEGLRNRDVIFSHHSGKGGRGAAVKRGFALALTTFPNVTHLLECDADGSHQPSDILRVINTASNFDLVIGSRYLPDAKISNWPKSRRIFSKALNKMIPRILGLQIRDVTNGLRRYSKKCAITIVNTESINTGFIYLSEQALIVSKGNFTITEIPIHFKNRTLGETTVTHKEIMQSLSGIVSLLPLRMK
jgi:dolichol-phosphate mannosyltransferase